MKRKKWCSLFLAVVLFLTGCGGKEGGNGKTGSLADGSEEEGLYDIELTEEAIALPLQEGESFLGVQYDSGERIWFIGDEEGQVFCYYENKGERELLLADVPASCRVGYTWYWDKEYFYVHNYNTLIVLRPNGEEAYRLQPEGQIIDVGMTREGEMVVAIHDFSSLAGTLQVLDREDGELSGEYSLSECYGIAEGVESGILLIDAGGVYDLDMESGKKTWYMKWNGTSYRPGMTGGITWAFRMTEEGILEQIKEVGGDFHKESLRKVTLEEMGKTPLVFKVLYANTGLKLLVRKFNQENQEYHVLLQDRGEEYGWDFTERNDMEIATGKGPDLLAENAVSDIYMLAQKGALENLEPYFEQEGIDRAAYHPAAFQGFGRDNGIYGVGYEMRANTLYIKEELTGNNIETLLDNMESYDGQAVFNAQYFYTPNKLLSYFFRLSDDFYGMVDWEGKTCDFSGELWEKILRVVKRYGITDRNRQWGSIATPVFAGEMLSFAGGDAAAVQEGMVLAGHPTENRMKHWLSVYGVSVNAASAHKEGAWQFIKFLLKEENQRLTEMDSNLPVHEQVLQELVAEKVEMTYYYGNPPVEAEMQEDQIARFWECLDNAEITPCRTEHILEIMTEEAELYFTEDKSIEEISGIIENRVKLYLAELE